MTNVVYIIATAFGLMLSYITIGFSLLGGIEFSAGVVISLLVVYGITFFIAFKKAKQKNIGLASVLFASPALILLLLAYALLAVQSLFNVVAPDKEFSAACEVTGVKIFHAPSKKVTSIGLDWDYVQGIPRLVYKVGFLGGLNGYESYALFPPLWVNPAQADVVVTRELSNPEEERNAFVRQKLIKVTLNVTDRRDGAKLASMSFAVDNAKGKACGTNVKGRIDIETFLRKALSIQGHDNQRGVAPPPFAPTEAIKTEKSN